MNLPEVVIHWRGGEGAIGRARAVERVAAQLGPRLGTLLQAIAALDGGSAVEVARVAAAARTEGQADVAEILDLLLAPRGSVHPTEVRKAAKARGIGAAGGFPILDLLRALAVYRTGTESPPAPPLRQAARTRSMLDLVVELLTSRSSRVSRISSLEAYLLRGAQVAATARWYRVYGHVHPQFLATNYDQDLLRLDDPRWSDLRTRGGGEREAVARRLRGEEPWTDGHDPASEWLYARKDRTSWLGPLCRAIAERISAGRLGTAHVMAHVAAHLAHGEPPLRDLAGQLVGLEVRLAWALGQTDDQDLARGLWDAGTLDPAERLRVAETLVAGAVPGEEDPVEPAAWVAARSADLDAVGSAVTLLSYQRDAASFFRRQGADRARALLVEAWLDAQQGGARAVASIPALVAGGQGRGAARLARDLDARPFPGLAEAAEALAGVAEIEGLVALAWLTPVLGTLPDAVRAAAERGLGAPEAERVGLSLAVLAAGGASERATAHVREEGRSLRLPSGAAEVRAATLVAAALTHAEGATGKVWPVVEPIARFLVREGPDRALNAAREVPERLAPGLVTVYLRLRGELGAHDGWLDFVVRFTGIPVPEVLAPMFADVARPLVAAALRAGPTTHVELLDALEASVPGAFRNAFDEMF